MYGSDEQCKHAQDSKESSEHSTTGSPISGYSFYAAQNFKKAVLFKGRNIKHNRTTLTGSKNSSLHSQKQITVRPCILLAIPEPRWISTCILHFPSREVDSVSSVGFPNNSTKTPSSNFVHHSWLAVSNILFIQRSAVKCTHFPKHSTFLLSLSLAVGKILSRATPFTNYENVTVYFRELSPNDVLWNVSLDKSAYHVARATVCFYLFKRKAG